MGVVKMIETHEHTMIVKTEICTPNGKRASPGCSPKQKKVKQEPCQLEAEQQPGLTKAAEQSNGQPRMPERPNAGNGDVPHEILEGADAQHKCQGPGSREKLTEKRQESQDYFRASIEAALQNRLLEFFESNPPGGVDKDRVADLEQQLNSVTKENSRLIEETTRLNEENARLKHTFEMEKEAHEELQEDHKFMKIRAETSEADVRLMEERIKKDELWMDNVDWKLVSHMKFQQVAEMLGRLRARLVGFDREELNVSVDIFDAAECPDFAGMLVALREKMRRATEVERELIEAKEENAMLEAEKQTYVAAATAQDALLNTVEKQGRQLNAKLVELNKAATQAKRQQAWHEKQMAMVRDINSSILEQLHELEATRRVKEPGREIIGK